MGEIEIVGVDERSGDIRDVAQWIVDEWGGSTLDETVQQLLNHEHCPGSLLAVSHDRTIGVVDFRRYQRKEDQVPTLWVNVLYVHKSFRGKGVGSLLLSRAMDNARPFGETLFVYTDVPTFYEARGWTMNDESDGSEMRTLSWKLSARP